MTTSDRTDALLAPREVAAVLNVGVRQVDRYVLRGWLPVAQTTPGGHRRFAPDAVEALRERTAAA